MGANHETLGGYLGSFLELNDERLSVADVGCSGGFDTRWKNLGCPVAQFGFDPLIEEISRLNREAGPFEVYECAFVVAEDAVTTDNVSSQVFGRTSAAWAFEILQNKGTSFIREQFNRGQVPTYTDRTLSLDSYFETSPEAEQVNFLKIDTDGADFPVLLGAKTLLASNELFGIQIEAPFHGSADNSSASTFSNIDFLLRQSGFTLYRLEPWEYSRRALPQPFVYDLAAQTTRGTVQWADAIYFRDPFFSPSFRETLFDSEVLAAKYLLGLLAFDFLDVVADVLVNLALLPISRERRKFFLDELASKSLGQEIPYRNYLKKFENDFEQFFPRAMGDTRPFKGENLVGVSAYSKLVGWIKSRGPKSNGS